MFENNYLFIIENMVSGTLSRLLQILLKPQMKKATKNCSESKIALNFKFQKNCAKQISFQMDKLEYVG